MTEQKLKLTQKEVEQLINDRLDTERFEEIFNDIPIYHPDHVMQKGDTHRSYCEDDGREYRWLIVKDTVTGVEHCLNYTFNKDWPNDIFDVPSSIEIVETPEESDIYVAPVPVVAPVEVLSPEAQADKDLWAKYKAIEAECVVLPRSGKIQVPKHKVDEILAFLKSGSFGAYQLRAVIIPICIEYKVEQNSFWHWLQVTRKVWKA